MTARRIIKAELVDGELLDTLGWSARTDAADIVELEQARQGGKL